MKKPVFLLLTLIYFLFPSCQQNKSQTTITFISPEAGTNIKSGSSFSMDLDLSSDIKIDSIVYLIDSSIVARKTDTSAVSISTSGLAMGNHLVTAKIYKGSIAEDVTSNIIITASKAPVQYTYEIVNTYPHDTTSYVEGLEYHDGVFYESDGQFGESTLRKADVKTGKILQKINIPEKYFAEGITLIQDKIIQLTYREGVGFVYDKISFKKLSEFNYQAGPEGWGLCFDGKQILNTDGSNNIHFLNKDTYQKEATLEVYNDQGQVSQLNELEFIDGKIYANVYQTDKIVIINPRTGEVEGEINLIGLLSQKDHFENTDVLNGIAWDATGKRLFVTGKKWNKLFEIKIIKK